MRRYAALFFGGDADFRRYAGSGNIRITGGAAIALPVSGELGYFELSALSDACALPAIVGEERG